MQKNKKEVIINSIASQFEELLRHEFDDITKNAELYFEPNNDTDKPTAKANVTINFEVADSTKIEIKMRHNVTKQNKSTQQVDTNQMSLFKEANTKRKTKKEKVA